MCVYVFIDNNLNELLFDFKGVWRTEEIPMKSVFRTLVPVILACFALSGCFAPGLIAMPLNILAAGAMGKSAQERKADDCANIEIQAEKDKASAIETRRRLTAANCPIPR